MRTKKRTKWIEVILSNKNFSKFLFDKILKPYIKCSRLVFAAQKKVSKIFFGLKLFLREKLKIFLSKIAPIRRYFCFVRLFAQQKQ